MKTVHVIQHTHWDREWYFTENDSRAVLYYFMEDLLTRLEQDASLGPFVLDGQTVVLEDYMQVAPENTSRLQALIAQGRILTGPWYTQTDFLVVGAESITRNLLLGHEDCTRWGGLMPVGYVPDSFGQSAQLPMFLNQFAINHAVIWRGWCEHDVAGSEFQWLSRNGSSVTTAVLPWGYGCAKWLPSDPQSGQDVVERILEKQGRFSDSSQVLLPNGNDQSPFEYQVPAMLDTLSTRQQQYYFVRSSFSQFFAALEASQMPLPVFEGELISPKYMRVHRGIFSTRTDIKQLNARLEDTLSRTVEPLLALNWTLGLPYPHHAVNAIWREAMKSQAHDSIGGCNSDRVNQMVKNRLGSGMEMAEQLLDLNMKMLAEGISAQQQGKKLIVFNALPAARSGHVAVTLYTPEQNFSVFDGEGKECRWQLISEQRQDMSVIVQELSNNTTTTWYRKCEILLDAPDIPACGYRTFYLQEAITPSSDGQTQPADRLENSWLRLELRRDGSLQLTDKRSGEQYQDVLQLVDGGDAGDNYNYSPPEQDWLISSRGCLASSLISNGPLNGQMTLSWNMPVPVDLAARHTHQTDGVLSVSMTLTLPHSEPWIDVQITVDNRIRDHRLQLLLPTGVSQSFHFADQPFGLIKRENRPAAMAFWQQENWTEAPAALYPMQSLVMMYQEQRGLCVATRGLREYEIPDGQTDTLAITLLRSVGWLGQADLPYRPGRASGMVLPSPASQIQGIHHFSLAVLPVSHGENGTFWSDIENWRTPLISYLDTGWSRFRTNPHGQTFPHSHSVLSWDSNLHFSVLKKAQHSDALIIRGWNPSSETLPCGKLKATGQVQAVTLAETPSRIWRDGDPVPSCTPVTYSITRKIQD